MLSKKNKISDVFFLSRKKSSLKKTEKSEIFENRFFSKKVFFQKRPILFGDKQFLVSNFFENTYFFINSKVKNAA